MEPGKERETDPQTEDLRVRSACYFTRIILILLTIKYYIFNAILLFDMLSLISHNCLLS